MDLNGHPSIRDYTLTFCWDGSYLHINHVELIKINIDKGKLHYSPLIQ